MFRRLLPQLTAVALVALAAPPAAASELKPGDAEISKLMGGLMSGQPDYTIREADRMIDALRPTDDPETIHFIGEVLTFRCEAQNVLGDYLGAKASCLEAIGIFKAAEKIDDPANWHTEDWHIARALAQLAASYAAIGNLDSALNTRLEELGRTTRSSEKPRLLVAIGDLQLSLGQSNQAKTSYLKAIAAQAEVRRDERNIQVSPHASLALLYLLEERFDLAAEILSEGIADTEQTQAVFAERQAKFGLHSSDLKTNAMVLQAQFQLKAWTYFHQGRFEDALATARNVLNFYETERIFGSPMITDVRILMARCEDALNPGSPAAKSYLQSAVGSARHDFMRATAQYEFARHHLLNNNVGAAEPFAQVAAGTLAWIEGDDSFHTARARGILARVLLLQGRHEEALSSALAAYAAQREVLPPYHSETGETLALLAELYEATGDLENLAAIETLRGEHGAARARFESEN